MLKKLLLLTLGSFTAATAMHDISHSDEDADNAGSAHSLSGHYDDSNDVDRPSHLQIKIDNTGKDDIFRSSSSSDDSGDTDIQERLSVLKTDTKALHDNTFPSILSLKVPSFALIKEWLVKNDFAKKAEEHVTNIAKEEWECLATIAENEKKCLIGIVNEARSMFLKDNIEENSEQAKKYLSEIVAIAKESSERMSNDVKMHFARPELDFPSLVEFHGVKGMLFFKTKVGDASNDIPLLMETDKALVNAFFEIEADLPKLSLTYTCKSENRLGEVKLGFILPEDYENYSITPKQLNYLHMMQACFILGDSMPELSKATLTGHLKSSSLEKQPSEQKALESFYNHFREEKYSQKQKLELIASLSKSLK